MRMDGGWERNVGEVAIWRLTTHFEILSHAQINCPFIRLPFGYAMDKRKNVRGMEKNAAYECINWIEWNWVWARERATVRKPKKMGKRNGENERIWVHTDDSEYDRTLRPQGLFHGLYFTNKPQPEKNTNRETERRGTQRKKISLALQCFLNAFFSV